MNSLALEADVQVDQARRERLLRSLKFLGFNERRNQVSDAYEETFQWIFMGDDGPTQEDPTGSDLEDSDWEDPDLEDIDLADPSEASWDLFSNWLSSTTPVYWISGKPGSGKTTLVKYVLNHPKTATYLDIWSPRALTISHFFWRPGSKMQQSIKGLLCSLLYQLLDNSVTATKHVLQYIQDQRLGVKDADTDWSVSELRSIFLQILHSYERPICIFIDGLDEVDPADGPLDLLELVEEFPRCRGTKLCLASRPEPALQRRLSAHPHIRLQDLTSGDLDRYARDHIKLTGAINDEDTSNSSWSSNAPWNPIESIVDKADGVFLWLVLAIKSVNKGFTVGDTLAMIQERIDCLPEDLTNLYKDMFSRACEDNPDAYRQIAALYFRFMLLDNLGPYDLQGLISVLELMLASTSIADKLLDAIERPLELLPEERMLKKCRKLQRNLELYCFGLVEVTQSHTEQQVVSWYGSQYSRLWSCYGQRYPIFIHRTARDFLLDTVEGRAILGHDDSSESSIFFRWTRAHLATSQLYADTRTEPDSTYKGVANRAEAYKELLLNYDKFGSWDQNVSRTISYFERLCSSGQLLSGRAKTRTRFCGGVDFLKVTASICCDESIWPVAKMRTLTTATLSEILLNLCDWISRRVEHGINRLLHEGADPNWTGPTFTSEEDLRGAYSQVRTPFTAYLVEVIIMAGAIMRSKQYRIAEVLRSLHAFLSHSAHLGAMLPVIFFHDHTSYGAECICRPGRLGFKCGNVFEVNEDINYDYIIVSVSAHTILQALLDCIDKELEHPRDREEARYAEIMWLISSIQKHLDSWSTRNDDRVIGRFAREGVENDSPFQRWKPVWYLPSEEDPSGFPNELLKELRCSLITEECESARRCRIISQLVQQISWTVRAKGFDETWESFAELGILAKVDWEVHDMQGWVDKFQKQRSADGSFADGVKVAESYIGNLNT